VKDQFGPGTLAKATPLVPHPSIKSTNPDRQLYNSDQMRT